MITRAPQASLSDVKVRNKFPYFLTGFSFHPLSQFFFGSYECLLVFSCFLNVYRCLSFTVPVSLSFFLLFSFFLSLFLVCSSFIYPHFGSFSSIRSKISVVYSFLKSVINFPASLYSFPTFPFLFIRILLFSVWFSCSHLVFVILLPIAFLLLSPLAHYFSLARMQRRHNGTLALGPANACIIVNREPCCEHGGVSPPFSRTCQTNNGHITHLCHMLSYASVLASSTAK
jgi:hypothetical protein